MSSNGEDFDREIARRFEAQRRADEASAPDVRKLLARPAGPGSSHRARRAGLAGRVLLAAAAVIVVAASVVLLRSSAPRASQKELPAAATQIAEWKAPTDVLLRTPGSDLLSQIPVLESRVSRAATADLEPTKGVEK